MTFDPLGKILGKNLKKDNYSKNKHSGPSYKGPDGELYYNENDYNTRNEIVKCSGCGKKVRRKNMEGGVCYECA